MEFTARYQYASISPRKVKNMANLIRGKHVNDALQMLRMSNERAAYILDKVLRSAVANADESLEADMENLRIKESRVDCAPTRKKSRFRARGRTTVERCRASHISIVLEDGQ